MNIEKLDILNSHQALKVFGNWGEYATPCSQAEWNCLLFPDYEVRIYQTFKTRWKELLILSWSRTEVLSFDCVSFRAQCIRSRAFSLINMSMTFWCFSSHLFSLTEHKPPILLCAKGKKDNWCCRSEPHCWNNSAIFPFASASCRLLQ